ncbi:hypothetical protein FGIG_03243 [Fasciola gigantica]|uniref:CUB domain-containing protein n=1 Tax=Fasciola gigantica TaxID=46835 RepID=A0A504YUN2_FASGI|nr:hypothetical protein FGIG_03243 [Fasciola gigantica]
MTLQIPTIAIGDEGNCQADYIAVGDTIDELPKNRYIACGFNATRWTFVSRTNHMVAKLWMGGKGLNTKMSIAIQKFDLKMWNRDVCGNGLLRVEMTPKNFRLPVYEYKFKEPTICHFKLFGTTGTPLGFHFLSMRLGKTTNCSTDYISIWEDGSEEKFVYCGEKPPGKNFTTYKNIFHIIVHIQTDLDQSFVRGIYYQETKDIDLTTVFEAESKKK